MLETIFGSILTAGLTGSAFVICLLVALALGALVAAVYMYKNTYTQSMAVTLALLPAMVQVIILLVNGNLGAGVAVAGAFSLVRFRSAPGSARDIMAIFLAMTVGLCCGMGYCAMAVLAAVVTCGILLLQGGQTADARERDIRVTVPENLDYSTLFSDLFAEHTNSYKLLRVKTVNMGSLYSLHYRVTLKDTDKEKNLLDAMRCRNGNLEISCGIAADGRQGDML